MKARQTRRKRTLQRGGNNNWNDKRSQFQQAIEKLINAGKLFGNTKRSKPKSKSKSKSKSNND